MPPTEAAILENYLLLPARLPSIISLQEFTSYFPKSQQSSPQIRTLYRDLQQQRNNAVDTVAANIDTEVRRARTLRRAVAKAEQDVARVEDQDDEMEIERSLFGPTSNMIQPKKHTLATILPEMENASDDIEREVQSLEAEEAQLLNAVRQAVGSMSDLRYGRLSNPQLRDEVLDGLKATQEICKRKS